MVGGRPDPVAKVNLLDRTLRRDAVVQAELSGIDGACEADDEGGGERERSLTVSVHGDPLTTADETVRSLKRNPKGVSDRQRAERRIWSLAKAQLRYDPVDKIVRCQKPQS